MQKYFAYGSNLDFDHFKSRCPSAIFFEKAVLEGYQLTFPHYDSEWRGGVAGIIPLDDMKVEGVIYEISDLDLNKLDEYEYIARGDYQRKYVIVKTFYGKSIDVWTYTTRGTGDTFYKPTELYKELIINGAILHGLSQEYIDYLRNF